MAENWDFLNDVANGGAEPVENNAGSAGGSEWDFLDSPQNAEGANAASQMKDEGRALGFFERHGTEAEAATGVRPSDAYNDPTVGKVMDVAYSVAPFTGTAARAFAGARQKTLDRALETGEADGAFGGMDEALKEWDETEGLKRDLYEAAVENRLGKNYKVSEWTPKDKGRMGLVVKDNESGKTFYLDDELSLKTKDEARKDFVKGLAAEQIGQTAQAKRNAQNDLENNTAAWYDNLAYGATASLGFAGEFYLGGALAKGVLGTAALSGTKLGKVAQIAEKGGELGWKAKTALTTAELAAPTVANAIARYENLTADDYRMDDNGDVYLAEEGDGAFKAGTKALSGAAFENATEVALGKVVNKVFGATCKGIYRKVPGVKKLFDGAVGTKVGGVVADKAKKAWVSAAKTYATVQKAAHFELMPVGEFAEEYVQGFGDEVIGFDTRASGETKGAADFTRDFFDWDAGGKDLFFGIMGQTIAMGLGAHGARRVHDFKNSVDAKVLGTLKLHGYDNADIAKMGTNQRIALANDLSRGKATADMGYSFADYARFAGVKESEIEQYTNNLKTMLDGKAFDALAPEQKAKLVNDVVQFQSVVYSTATAFEKGDEGAMEMMKHLDKRMKKAIMLMDERQGLGNYRNNEGTKPSDYTSRVDWTGSSDSAGNINWQTDEENGQQYIESAPLDERDPGVRIYRDGDGFRVFHPQAANPNGYKVGDLKEAHDYAASLDQFAQKKNADRKTMKEYVQFNAQRIVPTQTDKKTGERIGAPVVTVNNAQDALETLDWLSESDRRSLENAMWDKTEGGGYKTEDGTVLILVDNLRDTNDALLTLSHELGGHIAIREGTDAKNLSLEDTIAEVYKTSKSKDADKAKTEYRNLRSEGNDKEGSRAVAQEEGMVYGNEYRIPVASPLQKAKTAIKVWMKQHGMDAKLTDADYDAIAAAGLKRIRQTRTGETDTGSVDGSDIAVTPTVQGTDLKNRYEYGKWVSDYYGQREKLDAARAALDAAEAAKRNADAAAKEQAKIDKMVADEDERQRQIAEAEQMRKDAEHATMYGREMVKDVLVGWYGQKEADGDKKTLVGRIAENATDDEVRELLDYIDMEMDGKASEGTVLEVAKRINESIVRRTVSDKQKEVRANWVKSGKERLEKQHRQEREDLDRFIDEDAAGGMMDFLRTSGKLMGKPKKRKVKDLVTGKSRWTFADAAAGDALDSFFNGMNDTEKQKWERILFGEGAKATDVAGGDAALEELRQWFGNENYTFEDALNALRDERLRYEAFLANGRKTRKDIYEEEMAEEERKANESDNAAIAEAEENWGEPIALTADGKPVYNVDAITAGCRVDLGYGANGERLALTVAERNGDVVKCDADDGFGGTLSFKWNNEKGNWDYVEERTEAEQGGQDGDRTEDRGDAEPAGPEGREAVDAGAVGRESGRNGTAAEASSADAEGKVIIPIAIHEPRHGYGWYTRPDGISDDTLAKIDKLATEKYNKYSNPTEVGIVEIDGHNIAYKFQSVGNWDSAGRGGRYLQAAFIDGIKGFDADKFFAQESMKPKKGDKDNSATLALTSADAEGKVANASSFSRSRVDNVVFRTPFVGKNGAKLVAYSWKNKKIEGVDKNGDDVVRKISDWEESLTNPETSRDIVHHFTVVDTDGKSHVVSAETAAKMLGVNVVKARGEALKQVRREMKLRDVTDAQKKMISPLVLKEKDTVSIMPDGSVRIVGFRSYKDGNHDAPDWPIEVRMIAPDGSVKKSHLRTRPDAKYFATSKDEILGTAEGSALTLDGGTAQEIAAEEKRNRDRAEIERRQNAPLKGGVGEVGQTLMDLGGAEGEDLFNRTATEIRNAAKGEGGVKGVWRRLQEAGFKHRTEDEFVRSMREDKFADGETKKVGAQSIVYRIGDKVVKFRDVDGDVEDAVKKIEEFNKLFPDMAYTIRLETMTDNGGKERLVLEQPYVDALPNSGTEARKQLVAALQERFGADNVKTHGDINEKNLLAPKSWFSVDAGPWHIEDLKDLNLGIDRTDGKAKIWDAEIAYDAKKDAEGKAQGRWRRSAVTPAEDAAYMDAVKRGDMETAQRMVREAAAKAMPSSKLAYKGKSTNTTDYNGDIYLSSDKGVASSYSGRYSEDGRGSLMSAYVDFKNPLVIDAKGATFDEVPTPKEILSKYGDGARIKTDRLADAVVYKDSMSLDDIVYFAKDIGFDGVIVNNIIDSYNWNELNNPPKATDYVAFKSSQIKLADPVTYDDAGNVIPLSERFNAEKSDIRWRRTYTPNAEAQRLADIRVRAITDSLRDTKFGKDHAALFAAEKLARDLASQGSISPELHDLIERTKSGSVADRAKGNAAALFSPQNLSMWREKMQDALISLREMEDALGVAKDSSAYHQFDRNYGIVAKAVEDMDREIVTPLAKELKDNDIPLEDFSMLLQALHGPERNRMIAERSPYVLKALADKRTAPIVQGILNGKNGKTELNETDIKNIATLLGWTDKSGNLTKEGRDFADDLKGSGATTAYWNGKIADFTASGMYGKAQKAIRLVRKLTRRNRALLVATGRISRAQASLWAKLSPNYVPLRSDMDMESSVWSRWFLGGGKDGNGSGGKRYADNEYNHAYGRGTLADNPLEFAIQQYEESLQRAYDNVARQRLAELVRANPNLGSVFRYEPRMTATKRAHYAKAVAIMKNKVKAGTATDADIKKLNWYQEGLNADTNIPLVKVLGANGVVHEMPNIAGLEGTNEKPTGIVAFKGDGHLKFIKLGGFAQGDVSANPALLDDVAARRIATAVKKQNMAQLNGFGRAIRKATGIFSALRTAYSPTFLVSNFGADNTQAMRNIYATFGIGAVGKFEKYAYHSFAAANAVLQGKFNGTKTQQYAKEWYDNGGKIGGLATSNIAELTNDIKRTMRKLNSQKQQLADIGSVGDFIRWAQDRGDDLARIAEYANSVVEMSTRIAAYATCRDLGYSIADAVSYSRDITVNFNRKGTLSPWLNALYAFSNATMQDLHRSLVAFGEGRAAKGTGILLGRGAKMGLGLMLMGFFASLFGFWQDDEKDEKEGASQWKHAKDWQKQNTMGVRIGEKVYGVPIRGISRVPYYLGHQAYEMMSGRKNVVKAAVDTVALAASNATDFMGQASSPLMTAVPSVARDPIDIFISNKTFTGRQRYREPLPGQEETAVRSEMGRKGTSEAAVAVAKALNRITGGDEGKRGVIDVQPEKIQGVWEWLFGSAGKDMSNFVGTAKDIATGNIANRDLKNIPYLSRFARKLDENSADFYAARNRYEQARKHFDSMAELGDAEKMRKDIAENQWLSTRGNGKRWGEELKDLNNAVKKLMEIEKRASPDEYDAVHQLRLKTQYQFMRRLDTPPSEDAEGVADEREHRRAYAPLLRSSKLDDRRGRREEKKRRRALGM